VFNDLGQKWINVFVVMTVVVLSVYLHILAARTGLIVWYIFVAGWCLRFAFKKNMTLGIAIILLLVISSAMAVKYIPTLEKRVWYMRHTYELYASGQTQSGYSDMGRIISYAIATKLIVNNPVIGVGVGDILFEMNKGYDRWQPDVPQEYRLMPHNQFMIVCLGCGVLALLVFVVWVFYPLTWIWRSPKRFYQIVIWLSLFLAMMVEPMLEVQFGVFVYLFFLLWSKNTAVIEN
jgi:O-antigen ligase